MPKRQPLIPADRSYTEEHEWITVADGVGTVGITDYAQSELGDIVFVELPAVGQRLARGQAFGTVEAVKTVSELFSPVSGEVVEANHALEEDAGQVNREPYGQGWMIRVRLSRPDELADLLDAPAYTVLVAGP